MDDAEYGSTEHTEQVEQGGSTTEGGNLPTENLEPLNRFREYPETRVIYSIGVRN